MPGPTGGSVDLKYKKYVYRHHNAIDQIWSFQALFLDYSMSICFYYS